MKEGKKHFHLIAVGGVGMASLAGLLLEKGFYVTGSDKPLYPPMSDLLKTLGVPVKTGFKRENLEPLPDFVVIGNAVSKENPEVLAVLEKKIPYTSLPEALERFFLEGRSPIVVAGTHGKTTTSALLAWLLETTARSPGFFVGGILRNFNRSYQLGNGNLFVMEGDEYDSAFFDKGPKFLHYHPYALLLNPIEFDHADIYKDLPHLMTSFEALITKISSEGLVLAHSRNSNVRSLFPKIRVKKKTFGLENEADWGATDLELQGKTRFTLTYKGKKEGEILSPLFGTHNLENTLGVIGIFLELGGNFKEVQEALPLFQGVKKRQEVLGTPSGITLIEDFAHHPTAVHETLKGLRLQYPGRHLWSLFEPRSNTTRRRIFEKEFPRAFKEADEVILAPVYLSEKIPENERLRPTKIADEIRRAGGAAHAASSLEEVVEILIRKVKKGDVVCLMSNGDFGGVAKKILTELERPC